MGLKCYIVCVVMLSTLITHTVEGFRLNEVREVQTPANAIVEIVLEELDADKDGKIAISEVQSLTDRFLNQHMGPPDAQNFIAEITGYVMTVANIADADASGFIERNEIHRFASLLVNLAGDAQVGRIALLALEMNERINGHQYLTESIIYQIIDGADGNNDGQISQSELDEDLHLPRFRFWQEEKSQIFETVDINSDGFLNTAETVQWIEQLATHPQLLRNVIVYYRVVALAGRDAANAWGLIPL